jgi:hypothetical protein
VFWTVSNVLRCMTFGACYSSSFIIQLKYGILEESKL